MFLKSKTFIVLQLSLIFLISCKGSVLGLRPVDPEQASSDVALNTADSQVEVSESKHLIDDLASNESLPTDERVKFEPRLSGEFPPSVTASMGRLTNYLSSQNQESSPASSASSGAMESIVKRQVLPIKASQQVAWLNNRVKEFFFEEENLSQMIRVSKLGVKFPFQLSQHSMVLSGQPVIDFQMQQAHEGVASVLASNVGTRLYRESKSRSELWSLQLEEFREVLVDSPRIGMLMVGRGLFSAQRRIEMRRPEAESNRIAEAAILFHEARHSDGFGKHLGMAHAVCPEGHDLAHLPACDDLSNGAYRVSYEFVKSALARCASCTEQEKQSLLVIALDQMDRLISIKDGPWVDDRAETLFP